MLSSPLRYALLFACFIPQLVYSQILTKEDSLNAGLVSSNSNTVISGYGEVVVQYDLAWKTGVADLRRNVLFFGHKFNDKISFFSEMELEHASIELSEGKTKMGELAMEQLFLKFNLNKAHYITAGLFIPRLGIINENHLPTTFNGNDRPFVEQLVIPSTWREVGIGLYAAPRRIPGFNYSFAIMNGLNSSQFQSGTGIAEGRGVGNQASASNLSVTGAALYYYRNWRFQTSAYFGGTAGLTKREADSLQLNYGAFGTPVGVAEFNVQYNNNIIGFKALATSVVIPDAAQINRAYANNTASQMMGAYVEGAYNLMHLVNRHQDKNISVFVRYEWMDMNARVASNGIENNILKKQYIIAGITAQPTRGVVIKLDYVQRMTGSPNPELLATPYPQQVRYFTSNGFLNIGIGYSF